VASCKQYQWPTSIRSAQYHALRAVNSELVQLYWEIGESIHRKQEVLGWGKAVVQTLARDLQAEFPGRNGFSAQNLWLMRQFYGEYRDRPKLQPLVREIGYD
jgi:predicted nuclease of restriction endonuclease-like (RecB) superfamily